jgi:hypothetical protein
MKLKSRGESQSRLQAPGASNFSPGYRLTRPMKKIRCPHCSVINLEKFVTFPHCAGCGALLTEETQPPPRWAAWRRPIGPILWATVVGGAVVAAVGTLMLFDARPVSVGTMAVYGQVPRYVEVGNTVMLSLVLDTIDSNPKSIIQDAQLRLDTEFLRYFQVVAFNPKPLVRSQLGSGTYFRFDKLPREGEVRVTLRALRRGRYKMRAAINAQNQAQGDYQVTITVAPRSAIGPKTAASNGMPRSTGGDDEQ